MQLIQIYIFSYGGFLALRLLTPHGHKKVQLTSSSSPSGPNWFSSRPEFPSLRKYLLLEPEQLSQILLLDSTNWLLPFLEVSIDTILNATKIHLTEARAQWLHSERIRQQEAWIRVSMPCFIDLSATYTNCTVITLATNSTIVTL